MDKRRNASLNVVAAQAEKRIKNREFLPVRTLPKPHELDQRLLHGIAWIGSYSLTDARHIYVSKGKCWSHDGIWWTPGSMARDYLTGFGFKASRGFASQSELQKFKPQALYAKPGHYSDHAYVDLTAAYWSILRVTGWGLDYWPNRYVMKKDDVSNYPLASHKQARNALVGVATLTGQTRIWWKGAYQFRKVGNRWRNPHLWAWVQDVLHSVAWFALDECEAKYINTDGYIVPSSQVDKLLDFINWTGLEGRVHAEGDSEVHGVGAYRVGDRGTKRPVVTDRYFFNLNPDVRDGWALSRFRGFAKRYTVSIDNT